jgi:fibronectin type III domain protein
VPSTPDAPVWTGFGDGTLTAAWNAPATSGSPVSSYTLMLSPAPPGGNASVTTTGTSYTFRGLANGTRYTVQVRAHNRAPEPSPWSAASAVDWPAGSPGPATFPAGAVTSNAANEFTVRWNPAPTNGDDLRNYVVTVSGGRGAGVFEVAPSGAPSLRVPGVDNDEPYTVRVTARNKAGATDSESITAIAYDVPDAADKPFIVRTSGGDAAPGQGEATFGWNTPRGNGARVEYFRVLVNGAEVAQTGDNRYTVRNMRGGDAVSVAVVACNLRGCGPSSTSSDPATAYTRPAAPSGLQLTTRSASPYGRPTEATMSWSAPTDTGGRPIRAYRYELRGWGWPDISGAPSPATGTSATFALGQSNLENGRQVTIRVQVQTDAGWSDWAEAYPVVSWTEQPSPDPDPDPPAPGPGGTSP